MASSSMAENYIVGLSPPVLSRASKAATRDMILTVIAWTLCYSSILLPSSAFVAAQQTLPYSPSHIFIPDPKYNSSAGDEGNVATAKTAYILSTTDGGSPELSTLDISAIVQASSLSLATLSSDLPFLSGNVTAFAPSLTDNGSLVVYAGDCSSSTESAFWTLNLPVDAETTSSDWTQLNIDAATGPSFLGSSFTFSTTLESDMSPPSTYVYGGMCPGSPSNATSSQAGASYSNQMVKIASSGDDSNSYTVEPVASRGFPVPEAGFTFTGLSPSISDRSGTVTQQANYVLLGGHTQYAFVNMSTVALWSLPEESWGFVSNIGMAGSGTTNSELAVKSSTFQSVDSRSGHTAVLNEDGTALIVYGGWVGDTTQAASPQLAVLEIGAGYGGAGEWQWSVPDIQPSGPGIYGHGAALLPGNVMLIYGGHGISPTSEKKGRRQTAGDAPDPIFLNLTSMTWAETYVNPSYANGNGVGGTGIGDDVKQRLGLGLGLGLGVAALIAAVLVFFCYRRRLRKRHEGRESAIRALSQDTSQFLHHDDDLLERDYDDAWYTGGADPYMRGGRSLGYHSLQNPRGSMDQGRQTWWGDMPPMQQVNRKPVPPPLRTAVGARGQYQPAPIGAYDSPSTNRGRGGMNPIYEADEEDAHSHGDGDITNENLSPVRDTRSNRDSGHYSDPFLTPTQERQQITFPPPSRASLTPSPEQLRSTTTDPEVQDWMSDVDTADAILAGRVPVHSRGGRASPQRRGTGKSVRSQVAYTDDEGRTASNISESNLSATNTGANYAGTSRSGSVRSHLTRVSGFGVAAAATAAAILEGRGGSSSSSSAPSYNTARSSFPALQAEGPVLLMGARSGPGRDADEQDEADRQVPGSPSKTKPRRSWFGSLRRVFSGPTPSPSPPSSRDEDRDGPLRDSVVVEGTDFLGGLAAGGLLKRKGGRGAWENEKGDKGRRSGGPGYYGEPSTSADEESTLVDGQQAKGARGALKDEDEDWDIEKAIERRLVQVMFTVPKERLRVVNAEPDVDSGESIVIIDPEKDEDESDEEGQEGQQREVVASEISAISPELLNLRKQESEPLLSSNPPESDIGTQGQPHGQSRNLGLAAVPVLAPIRYHRHQDRHQQYPLRSPSPMGDDARPLGSGDNPEEKEALRREFDSEWENIGVEDIAPLPLVSSPPQQEPRPRPPSALPILNSMSQAPTQAPTQPQQQQRRAALQERERDSTAPPDREVEKPEHHSGRRRDDDQLAASAATFAAIAAAARDNPAMATRHSSTTTTSPRMREEAVLTRQQKHQRPATSTLTSQSLYRRFNTDDDDDDVDVEDDEGRPHRRRRRRADEDEEEDDDEVFSTEAETEGAQAPNLHKPRSRVLAIVENIESKSSSSRENSPRGSPTRRGSPVR